MHRLIRRLSPLKIGAEVTKSFDSLLLSCRSPSILSFITLKSTAQNVEKRSNIKHDPYVLVEIKGKNANVALVQLNRPKTFNTLSRQLMKELSHVLNSLNSNDQIGCIVLTGSRRAFAAGADIPEMQHETLSNMLNDEFLRSWSSISNVRQPMIAAVNGLALGGGCELSMMCDIIYAGDKAEFGQPEILLGIIPGAGGTQRLPRFVGKSKAMEMILTGNRITAEEAERLGLISRVFPADQLIDETLKIAEKIADHSKISLQLAKESLNFAFETTLSQGERHAEHFRHITSTLIDFDPMRE